MISCAERGQVNSQEIHHQADILIIGIHFSLSLRELIVTDNVLDFESLKQTQLLKRKQERVDALRKAFRLARGETGPDKPASGNKTRSKAKKK